MERTTITPTTEKRDLYLIAKLLTVDTKELPGLFEIEDQEVIIDRIIQQLEKIPYIPFPVSLGTVDVAPYKINDQGEFEVLLGRKAGLKEFQFIGGFMEPKHSKEKNTLKELNEETDNSLEGFYSPADLRYITSMFIDDSRYKTSCHKVTTSFFTILVDKDVTNAKAGDDIEEVKWFKYIDLKKAYKAIMRPIHHELMEQLMNAL